MLLIDRIGRKPLILIGLIGVVISMGITSYGFSRATYMLKSEAIVELSDDIDKAKLSDIADKAFNNDVDFKNALKGALGTVEYDRHEGEIIQAAITIDALLILVGILLFIASFAVSLGPVMWVILSEIFPNMIRGVAIAVVGFVNSLSSFLVQLLFPWELSNLGNAFTYAIFGVFAVIGFFILLKILPETKNKSLEEIEKELVKV